MGSDGLEVKLMRPEGHRFKLHLQHVGTVGPLSDALWPHEMMFSVVIVSHLG